MKLILFTLILFTLPHAYAESVIAELKNQKVQVRGEESQPTSCRLYRKRMETFLQRIDEASLASSVRTKRLTMAEATRLLDLIQRSNMPLDLMDEKIILTLDFDLSKAARLVMLPEVLIEIDSTYLHWQTTEGLFPDHMMMQILQDSQVARINYKMTYMEACLAPLALRFRISDKNGNSAQGEVILSQDFL